MGIVGIVLLVVFIISAILLVLVVLLQDEQGEGLSGIFGGGSNTPFGSRAGNVLTRFTAIVAAIFIFCSLTLAWINRSPEAGNVVARARAQTLKEAEQKSWWVETEKKEPAQATDQQQGSDQQTDAQGQKTATTDSQKGP